MARVCGPILGFRGEDAGQSNVVVLVVHDGDGTAGDLTHSALPPEHAPIPPALLAKVAGLQFISYTIAATVEAFDRTIEYRIGGEDRAWRFTVAGRSSEPRIAYASCNGFSQTGDMKKIADKNAVWSQLLSAHEQQAFHLLLMGGDQIYADQLWEKVPELRQFNELPRHERVVREPGPALADDLPRFFATTYCDRFSQVAAAQAMASIPTLMMWDDHDIFDGWGSYSDEEQVSPVFRAIFAAARTCFVLFQLQSGLDRPSWPMLPGSGGFNAFFQIRDLGLLILDLRSERSQHQVLSPQSWTIVFEALDAARGLKHLLVMSSIPVVHPDMSSLERSFGIVPGQQDLEDDLHDQWSSYLHKLERLRLVHRLLDFSAMQGTRVTILSGDVHVAALGVLESTRRAVGWQNCNVINQLTSSAIVHPPPPRVVRAFLEQLGREVQEIDRDITAQMLQFPATNYRFVAARNWLSLEFDDRGRIWANWHVEGQPEPLTKVVHPCEPELAIASSVR